MYPTLRQLRYLVALGEAGSFGAAADRVHVSQPALSVQIRELENGLGAQLVERLPRGLRLTPEGREAMDRARRILAQVKDLELAVRHARGLGGRLALGLIPTVAPYLLPPALERLAATAQGLAVQVREAQTADLLARLEQGQLDAAVVASPVGPSFEALHLMDDRFLLAGSKAQVESLAAQPEALRPSALPGDRLLLLDEGHCLADQALDVCQLPRRRPADLGASSLATLVGLVRAGFGLTLLPEIAAATEAGGALGLMRFAAPEPSRSLFLVVRKGSGAWSEDLARPLREALLELRARSPA